ncbi:MAG: hypothetical protein AB7P53_03750, partial [Candidatus Dadabacteria bacterium]
MTGKFLLARTLTGIFVVFAVATITFFMLRTLPGGPFDTEKKLPPRIKENIEAKYRLDKPLSVQYLEYMKDLARGDFGPSYKYIDRSVNEIIRETLPVSAQLGLISLVLAVAIGSAAGIAAASKQGGFFDFASVSVS